MACLISPLVVFVYFLGFFVLFVLYGLARSTIDGSFVASPMSLHTSLESLFLMLLVMLIAYVITATFGLAIYLLLYKTNHATPVKLAVAGSLTSLSLFFVGSGFDGIDSIEWNEVLWLLWMFCLPAAIIAVVFGRIAGFSSR